ncbi:LysM peptidoglycan-binding domain-containing protein [Metabacillus fastidiosus]|uniref:LysM peptidoglycan-binding domain-containing protein n=1 Tax=Metabacillus fastidiosus TaxID=1458 RepID=UPI003D265A55
MAKSIYEMWISTDDGEQRFRFPVLPQSIEVSNSSKNESVDIAKFGEVTILQKPGAEIFSFSSFFPIRYSPLVEYNGFLTPWDCVKMFKKWKEDEKVLRFVITGTMINSVVSLEEFNFNEDGGDVGNINYSLTLKEFKYVNVKKITKKKKISKKARPFFYKNPKNNQTYTVKKGDTLWALARKYYGDGSKWNKIWEANKDAIIKRDKRNLKQPGHWIHIGAKLVIPK